MKLNEYYSAVLSCDVSIRRVCLLSQGDGLLEVVGTRGVADLVRGAFYLLTKGYIRA